MSPTRIDRSGRRAPTREELAAAKDVTVPDLIAPGLGVLFCGINPGLYSGAVGHHFARPGNRFWKVLHLAGLTPSEFAPEDERQLLGVGLGITNLVARSTARADELGRAELTAGAAVVMDKVVRYAPRAVAVLGMLAFKSAFGRRAVLGRQPEGLGGAQLFVLPNTSGLQARYQLDDLVRAFGELVPFALDADSRRHVPASTPAHRSRRPDLG